MDPEEMIANWVDRYEYGLANHHDFYEMWAEDRP